MRLRLVPTLLLFTAWSWAAETVPTPAPLVVGAKPVVEMKPVVEVQLADGKDLIAHWDQTPWAKAWADPALKPLHKPVDDGQAEFAKKMGGTPLEMLTALSNGNMTVAALPTRTADAPKPVFPVALYMGADFGAFATKLFALAKENKSESVFATVVGADEALGDTKKIGALLARYATSLAFGIHRPPVKPTTRTKPLADDLYVHIDIPGLFDLILAALPDDQSKETLQQSKKQLADLKLTEATYRLHLIPEGFLEEIDAGNAKLIGYQPVDRALLARLPSNVLMMASIGYNGAAAWKEQRGSMLASWAKLVDTDPADSDATEKAINAKLTEFGIGATVNEVFTGLTGTSLVAITPAMPFPAMSLVLPRSPVADKLIALGLSKLGTKPPEEGASILIPIPNAPVAVTLVCDKTTWMVSSDALMADTWLAAKPSNGWADSATGKLALSKAPTDAYVIGSSDTPSVLRLIAGYAGMGLAMAKGMPPDQRQAILQGINVLAANAATGYVVAGSINGRQRTEIRSITGMVPGVFIVGGIAGGLSYLRGQAQTAPGDVTEPEVVVDPLEPRYVLRERILPAQEQFKGGAYRDQNGNGNGEYGLLSELAGRRDVGEGQRLALIEGPLARGATAGGYSYTIYLPGGTTRVADDGKTETRPSVPANAETQEKSFVAYSWPSRAKDGTMYALTNGVVYQAPYTGMPPAWNAVFGGAGFGTQPTWETATAPDQNAAPAPAAEPVTVP